MPQVSFVGRSLTSRSDSKSRPSVAIKTPPRRGAAVLSQAIEALESRRLLSVNGFQPAVNYAAGRDPSAMASGDFNGDGRLDLVVADPTDNGVTVLLGRGDGTFGSPTSWDSFGSYPTALALGDFNGDGKLDLAVANETSNTVCILRGDGVGGFGFWARYTVGSQPVAIVVTDFNFDGRPDLATANASGSVTTMEGGGNFMFTTPVTAIIPATAPSGLATADFNRDGISDLAVSSRDGSVTVLTCNQGGRTSVLGQYFVQGSARGITVADLNGDQNPDLVVTEFNHSTVNVLTNLGGGSFSTPATFSVGAAGTGPTAVTVADFNGDGLSDIATANFGVGTVSVLIASGNGTFRPAVTERVGSMPSALIAADFNGDGATDLVTPNAGDNNASVLLRKQFAISTTGPALDVGVAGNDVKLGWFTDSELGTAVGDYTVTILWGDGTSSSPTKIYVATRQFTVYGSHTYQAAGEYKVTIVVADTVGMTASGFAWAGVVDAPIAVTHLNHPTTEGTTWSGTFATFTDANSFLTAGDFTAEIDWGDGTTSSGIVVGDGNGSYDITSAHLYAAAGTYLYKLTIDCDVSREYWQTGYFTVANGSIHAAATSALSTTEGTAFADATILAHFTDTNLSAAAADFAATVDWGDGQTGNAAVLDDGAGGFYVEAGHTYEHAGSPTFTVTIQGAGDEQAVAGGIAVANAVIAVSGASALTTVEGADFSGAVATFTDANALAAADDFTASIDWGDGFTSAGVITAIDGAFVVTGDHAYAHLSNDTITVTILGAGGSSLTSTSAMTVTDASFTASLASLTPTEGVALTNVKVGTISDANLLDSASDFRVSVNWGDGTAATVVTLVQTAPGLYDVLASHTFARAGGRTVTLIAQSVGGASQTTSSAITVRNAAISAVGVNASATAGKTFSGKIAHFTDANASSTAADFSAYVLWADGTSSRAAVAASAAGGFDVVGTHAWRTGGGKVLTVTITGAGGGTAVVTPTVAVAPVVPALTGLAARGTRGVSLTAALATITTTNALALPGDFTAFIAWGDGTTSTGAVVARKGGGFNIVGTHTYTSAGTYVAKITLYTAEGTRLVIGATVSIARPV